MSVQWHKVRPKVTVPAEKMTGLRLVLMIHHSGNGTLTSDNVFFFMLFIKLTNVLIIVPCYFLFRFHFVFALKKVVKINSLDKNRACSSPSCPAGSAIQ